MNSYNNLIHSTPQYTPCEIFYSNIEDLFEEVEKNYKDNFNFLNKLYFNFSLGEYCLVKNNFLIVNQKDKNGYYYLVKINLKKISLFIKFVQ